MSSWNGRDSRKSINRPASAGWSVPARTPANSIWRKQLEATTAVGAASTGGSANTTSATGLEAYDTTIGWVPSPPPAPENSP